MKLLVATTNAGKLKEIRNVLQGFPLELLSLADFSNVPEVEEDAPDFVGNALKKARAYADFSGEWVLADDSGLVVPSLCGKPGVHSARYAGPKATDGENVAKLLREMEGVPSREAYFICVLALMGPEGESTFEGRCEGVITRDPRGSKGFGYDPVFMLPETGKTLAEMDLKEKTAVSHRGRALDLLVHHWANHFRKSAE